MSVGPGAKHVPAWKRLGLKLKRSQDSLSASGNQQDEAPPLKKTKQDTSPATKSVHRENQRDPADSVSQSSSVADVAIKEGPASQEFRTHSHIPEDDTKPTYVEVAPRAGKKRSKSVTFTTDTKAEDGSTAKIFPAPSTDPLADVHESITASPPAVPEVAKKQKDRTSKKVKDKSNPIYLQYLVQFHSDRENWKFNKSKQTDLLKNLWNTYRIPSHHDDALIAYLGGLQGQAARRRLFEDATRVIEVEKKRLRTVFEEAGEPCPEMTSKADRDAAREQAIQRAIEQARQRGDYVDSREREAAEIDARKDDRQRSELDARAERVLSNCLDDAINGRPIGTTKTKRKSRTVGSGKEESDDDDSTSESTTDSSEESDSDDESSDEDSDSTISPIRQGQTNVNTNPAKGTTESSESEDESSTDEDDDGEHSESDEDGVIFGKAFLDKHVPKKDWSHLKAKAKELKWRRAQGK